MTFDRQDSFSFILKPTGEVVRAMPDDEQFSVQQICDHVAGRPEALCETPDGFLLFRNRDAGGLPVNDLATSIYAESSQQPSPVTGRVLLAHPDHIPAFWRRTLPVVSNHSAEGTQHNPSPAIGSTGTGTTLRRHLGCFY